MYLKSHEIYLSKALEQQLLETDYVYNDDDEFCPFRFVFFRDRIPEKFGKMQFWAVYSVEAQIFNQDPSRQYHTTMEFERGVLRDSIEYLLKVKMFQESNYAIANTTDTEIMAFHDLMVEKNKNFDPDKFFGIGIVVPESLTVIEFPDNLGIVEKEKIQKLLDKIKWFYSEFRRDLSQVVILPAVELPQSDFYKIYKPGALIPITGRNVEPTGKSINYQELFKKLAQKNSDFFSMSFVREEIKKSLFFSETNDAEFGRLHAETWRTILNEKIMNSMI